MPNPPILNATAGDAPTYVRGLLGGADQGDLRVILPRTAPGPMFVRADGLPMPAPTGVPALPFTGYILRPGDDVRIQITRANPLAEPSITARFMANAVGTFKVAPGNDGIPAKPATPWAFATVPAASGVVSIPVDGVLGRRTGYVRVHAYDFAPPVFFRGDTLALTVGGDNCDYVGVSAGDYPDVYSGRCHITNLVGGIPTLRAIAGSDSSVAVTLG